MYLYYKLISFFFTWRRYDFNFENNFERFKRKQQNNKKHNIPKSVAQENRGLKEYIYTYIYRVAAYNLLAYHINAKT